MAELRWALLLTGLIFVVGLVFWERRKRRSRDVERAGIPGIDPSQGARSSAAQLRAARDASFDPGAREEPTFSMPGLPRRDPVRDLPVVEIDPRTGEGPGVGDLPVFDMAYQNRNTIRGTDGSAHVSEPRLVSVPGEDSVSGEVPLRREASVPSEASLPGPVERASAWLADSVPAELPQTPVLDWPPEEQRQIVALRVVPRAGERFTGAALRQALVGEGFVHGEFEIYHKPTGDGRVVISAASLTRPGTFDPRTIDGLLFAGLNLFAVMPGPLPPRDTIERLCLVARTLAQRLRGDTQDSRGQPLTDARVAELRREASDEAP